MEEVNFGLQELQLPYLNVCWPSESDKQVAEGASAQGRVNTPEEENSQICQKLFNKNCKIGLNEINVPLSMSQKRMTAWMGDSMAPLSNSIHCLFKISGSLPKLGFELRFIKRIHRKSQNRILFKHYLLSIFFALLQQAKLWKISLEYVDFNGPRFEPGTHLCQGAEVL